MKIKVLRSKTQQRRDSHLLCLMGQVLRLKNRHGPSVWSQVQKGAQDRSSRDRDGPGLVFSGVAASLRIYLDVLRLHAVSRILAF